MQARPPVVSALRVRPDRLALIVLTIALIGFGTLPAQESRSTVTPSPGGKTAARALGRLEPVSGLIAVGVRPGARVDALKVEPGQLVKAGDLLALLEGRKQAERQLDLHKKKLALEREQFDRTQKAKLDAAEAVAKAVKERLDKATPLYRAFGDTLKGKDKFDAEMAFLQIETQASQSALNVTLLKIAGEMTEKQRALEDAELKSPVELEPTEVRAPADGRVLEIKTHPGETSAGVVLTMGDTTEMAAIAEVFQTDVPRIAVGDRAEVRILDRTVTGKVTAIGLTVSRNQLTSLDPRALQDRRVVEVTVRLDQAEPASHYVNMEVDVLVNPGAK